MVPEYLVIGQVVADQTTEGLRAGGSAAYAAWAAAKLGLRAAVVTSPHVSLDVEAALGVIPVHLVGPAASTTFLNTATPSSRVQLWYGSGPRIGPKDVPAPWRGAAIVHLAPVAQEVDLALPALFPTALVGVTPQGWYRRRDASGRVYPGPWRGAQRVLSHARAVVVSPEDYGAQRRGVLRYLTRAPVLIVTQGPLGARLWSEGRWRHIPAFPARAVDTTGAGDVFAAAFLARYAECGDALEAARFASCAASLSVEGVGASALPTRDQVLARLRTVGEA